jgi:hypothetical protein
MSSEKEVYTLKSLHVKGGIEPEATIELEIGGDTLQGVGYGNGPIDAVYNICNALTTMNKAEKVELERYSLEAISEGSDSTANVFVRLKRGGESALSRGKDVSVILASTKAYLNALNKLNGVVLDHLDKEYDSSTDIVREAEQQRKRIEDQKIKHDVADLTEPIKRTYILKSLDYETGTKKMSKAMINLEFNGNIEQGKATKNSPVDAVYEALKQMTETKGKLASYSIVAIGKGTDAPGEVYIELKVGKEVFAGYGQHTDVIVASGKAYVAALNEMASFQKQGTTQPSPE